MIGGNIVAPRPHPRHRYPGRRYPVPGEKGDVIVVQAGTPHWFKEAPKSVNDFVVKVLK